MMRRLVLILGLVVAVTLAAPAVAQDKPTEEHDEEPCVPESIFDDRCDEGGSGQDRCFENCRACTTINNRFGCYAVYWAGACSCYTEWIDNDGEPLLTCNERGTCSVIV